MGQKKSACLDLLSNYANSVNLYYHIPTNSGFDLEDVIKLAKYREPVNIEMNRYYKKDMLKQEFGYEQGLYRSMSKNGTILPPQIAIACITPVEYIGDQKEYYGHRKEVTMINTIGFAFDSTQQPDFQYFYKNKIFNKDELLTRMILMYKFAFKAASDYKKKYLCVSPI